MNIPAEFRRESPHERHTPKTRLRRARRALAVAALLLLGANALMLAYVFRPAAPLAPLAGMTFGNLLASAVLLGAIWQGQIWARYILICVIWSCFVIVCVPLLQEFNDGASLRSRPPQQLIGVLVCYAAANFILIRSRSIRRMMSPGANRIPGRD